jgi:hypothetical protein
LFARTHARQANHQHNRVSFQVLGNPRFGATRESGQLIQSPNISGTSIARFVVGVNLPRAARNCSKTGQSWGNRPPASVLRFRSYLAGAYGPTAGDAFSPRSTDCRK